MPATTYPGTSFAMGNDTAAAQEASPGKPGGRKMKSNWIWIPLSFIFLLLGVVLGFQIALSVNTRLPTALRFDPYALNLSVTPAGDSLHVRWDRNAPAIQSSTRGTLFINDGGNEKAVGLDSGQLQNGSVIYRRASPDLKFRLEVFARDRVSVSETLDYRANSASPR